MKKSKFLRILISFLVIFCVLFIWYILTIIIPSNVIPNPLEVGSAFIKVLIEGDNFGYTLFDHIFASLLRVLVGFYFALIFALIIGLLMGLSRKVKLLFSPIVEILRPIPPFAWIPFVIALSGIGLISQSIVIFIGAFFPILTNTLEGVQNVSPIHVDVAKTLGANRSDIILHVVLPSSLPSIFIGIRVGLGVGWMCLIAAELIGLNEPVGLGYLINFSADMGNYSLSLVAILITGLIGYGINYSVRLIENYKFNWRDTYVKS
ncbi:MAG: ABC transporter permease [Candidatus Lokiarchaeota archaeon]|nr:ABC transporter permease [Candidatus Lokiarchaeota archaeon]